MSTIYLYVKGILSDFLPLHNFTAVVAHGPAITVAKHVPAAVQVVAAHGEYKFSRTTQEGLFKFANVYQKSIQDQFMPIMPQLL